MCRLYNTVALAAAAATPTAAMPAAVRSRRRMCGAGCVDDLNDWRRMMLEVYRKHQGVPVLRLHIVWICMQVARLGSVPCVQNINVLPAVIHGRAHPASVHPLPVAQSARTLTIPTIAKYSFKNLDTQAFLGKKILKSGCTIKCRSRVLRQQCV